MSTQTLLLLLVVAAAINAFMQSSSAPPPPRNPAPRRAPPPPLPDESAFTSPDLEHEARPVEEAQASLMLDHINANKSNQMIAPAPEPRASMPTSHYDAVMTQAVRMGFMPMLRA